MPPIGRSYAVSQRAATPYDWLQPISKPIVCADKWEIEALPQEVSDVRNTSNILWWVDDMDDLGTGVLGLRSSLFMIF